MNHMGDLCPGPEALAGWLEQTLSTPERAKITAHLASCDECRRAVTIASAIEPQAPGAVDEILLHRVVTASRRRSVAAWITAAAAILVAAILFWPHGSKPAPIAAAPTPAPPAPITMPTETKPESEIKKAPEAPIPAPPVAPTPAPETKPGPTTPETPKEEPKKTVVATETPKPAPTTPAKEESAPIAKKEPGKTEVDTSSMFASVFVLDPTGDLWLNRQGGEAAPVGRFEQVGHKDTLSTHAAPGAFALEGKATLALDKNTSATVAWRPADKVYALSVAQGAVLVDTENSQQSWKLSGGKAEFVIANVNGRFVVEPRGEQLAAVMLTGRADVRSGTATRHVDADRSGARDLVATVEGKFTEEGAKIAPKKYAPLATSRPKAVTVFSATFKDKEKEESLPFAYSIPMGRIVTDGPATVLRVEVPANAYKSGDKAIASSAVKPERPIEVASNMLLQFRYRTNLPVFTVKLGDYSAIFTPHVRGQEWGSGEIPLESFSSQGVFLSRAVQSQLTEVQFQAAVDGKKASILDLDGIQFLKRTR
jgi:anti-sigma factor ChrR (cupin superfamily)